MLTGVDFRQAIKYWTQGREVIVIDRSSLHASGGYDNFPFEDLFKNVELLADVPAVEDPGFRQEVEDMVSRSDQGTVNKDEKGISTQEAKIAKELKDSAEDTETPPPPHGAGEERRSGRKAKKGTSYGIGC